MKGHCGLVITPDSIRDKLEDFIVYEILKRTKGKIIWGKYLTIDKKLVDFLYPKKVAKSYYPSMVKNIILGKSLILLLEGEKDISTKIKQAKGRFYIDSNGKLEVDGLRLKYGARIVRKNNGISEIYEFRFHATDNLEEAITFCILFMDNNEINSLQSLASEIYFGIKRTIITKHFHVIKIQR
jgi:nucleoside diphosphate kinase